MKKIIFLAITLSIAINIQAQNLTDASLFMRADSSKYLEEVSSETGDLYRTIGHHGPAVENEWMALRIYFDHKCAIDAYSKAKSGLELKAARWYPTPEQQKNGWGADYYKVGSTVGLGGVRIWDGEKILELDPVTKRTAKVYKTDNSAVMEMISEGVPVNDKKVDILVRVTVTNGDRYATVEAEVLSGGPLNLVTGINYHNGMAVVKDKGMIATWGLHPEDVAAELVDLGSAIKFNPSDFQQTIDDGKQVVMISKPTTHLTTKIITVNERMPIQNNLWDFVDFLNQ